MPKNRFLIFLKSLSFNKRTSLLFAFPTALFAALCFTFNFNFIINFALLFTVFSLYSFILTKPFTRELDLLLFSIESNSPPEPSLFKSCPQLHTLATNLNSIITSHSSLRANESSLENNLLSLKDQIDRSNAEKTKLANNIHTTFRGGLNRVRGPLEKLSRSTLSAQESSNLEKALNELYKLISTNRELGEFSSVDFGAISIERNDILAKDILTGVLSHHSDKAHQKGLLFDIIFSGNAWHKTLNTDAIRIRQIIHNLIENAINHTSHGSIYVRAHSIMTNDSECIMTIDIDDTGSGIDPDTTDEIEEIFNSDPMDEVYTSLGIGLPLCSRLIKLLDGSINLRTRVGQGSTFTISLPLRLSTVSALPSTITPNKPTALAPRVLILDHNDNSVISELLIMKNIVVHTTHEHEKALKYLNSNNYDFIFFNLNIDSYLDFAFEIRQSPLSQRLPLIGISDDLHAQYGELSSQLSLEDVIYTPLKAKQLSNYISSKVQLRDSVNNLLACTV